MHCDIDPLHNKYLTHCCCSILTITDIVPAALDHNPTQHSSSRSPHDTIILAPLKAAPQHSPPAPLQNPSSMQGNAAIAIILACILVGSLGLYYALKAACLTLAYMTWGVGRKETVDVELVPPSSA